MKGLLFYSLIFFTTIIFGCNQDKNGNSTAKQTCPTLQDGIDTSIYKITSNKNGNLILLNKATYQNIFEKDTSLTTEQIRPVDADTMIGTYIKPDVDAATHILGSKLSKYVVFDIEKLTEFYNRLVAGKKTPDSLRIYFGTYKESNCPEGHLEYKDRMTCILVGMQGPNDIRDERKVFTYPINIGTLCPPNCDKSNFNKLDTGAIYLKLGGRVAGATNW